MKPNGNRFYFFQKKEERMIEKIDKQENVDLEDLKTLPSHYEVNEKGRCWTFD